MGGGTSCCGRQQQWGEAAAVGGGSSGGGRQNRWGRAARVGTDDGSCSRPANLLTWARRQRVLEMAPPSRLNGPPLRRSQIQYTRQIETDTVQSSGSYSFSDTVQSSGLRPCASLAACNRSVCFLARNESTTYLPEYPFPSISNFYARKYGLLTAVFPASIWSKKQRRMRHVWGELDQNITVSERTVPGYLKGPGNGNVGR